MEVNGIGICHPVYIALNFLVMFLAIILEKNGIQSSPKLLSQNQMANLQKNLTRLYFNIPNPTNISQAYLDMLILAL